MGKVKDGGRIVLAEEGMGNDAKNELWMRMDPSRGRIITVGAAKAKIRARVFSVKVYPAATIPFSNSVASSKTIL